MSKETVIVRSGRIGFAGLLSLLFIGLKLTGVINWSWWLVLLPLYAPIALLLGVAVFALVIAAICSFCVFLLDKFGK